MTAYQQPLRPRCLHEARQLLAPNRGGFEFIEGTVPTGDGSVYVYLSRDRLEVKTETDGGTLVFDGKKYVLEKNKVFKMGFEKI